MFSEYESMENHYNLEKTFDLTKIDPEMIFVCTEKIHGTNYSLICDGVTVTPCKRTSSLGSDRSFFNHGYIYDKYKDDLFVIYGLINEKYGGTIQQVQLYGELFGGYYNGKSKNGHKIVQKGMNYSLENEFMAYDLKVLNKDGISFYYDYVDLKELLNNKKITIKLVPELFMGNFEEVLKLNPKFESTVHSLFGLPKIEGNYAEGYVVKSIKEKTMSKKVEGDDGINDRMVFKFKNPSFSESGITSKEVTKEVEKVKKISYVDILKKYINEMRYENVSSKLMDDEKDKLETMLYNDALKDFIKDNEEVKTNEKELELCKRQLLGIVKKFLSSKN